MRGVNEYTHIFAPDLEAGGPDVHAFPVLVPLVEHKVERPAVFYGVVPDFRSYNEVLQTDALRPVPHTVLFVFSVGGGGDRRCVEGTRNMTQQKICQAERVHLSREPVCKNVEGGRMMNRMSKVCT